MVKQIKTSSLFVSRGTILIRRLLTCIHLCVIAHKIPEETTANDNYLHSRATQLVFGSGITKDKGVFKGCNNFKRLVYL